MTGTGTSRGHLPRRGIPPAQRTAAARRTGAGPVAPAVLLPLAVIAGLVLRLLPCWRDPGFDFVVDAACYARLVREILAHGALPAVDALCNAPLGRPTAELLPTGLFAAGAAAHRALAFAGATDLRWSLAILVALAGALVAVPVWFGARAVWGDSRAAALAALVAVFVPAHLQRTHGTYFRFDALGTLAVATHGALVLAALAEERAWPRRALAVAAALALAGALALWRVSGLVLVPELLVAAAWLLARGATPALRDLALALAVAATPGLALVPYLRAQGFVFSPAWLAMIGLAAAMLVPATREGGRAWVRALTLALVALVAAGAAAIGRHGAGADYGNVGSLLVERFGLHEVHDPDGQLMLQIEELAGTSPWRFVSDPRGLFLVGAWLVAGPVAAWLLAKRPGLASLRTVPLAPVLLVATTATFAAFTLLFNRTGAVLAPFALMALAGLAGRGAGTRPAWLHAALAASALGVMSAGVAEASRAYSHYGVNERAAYAWLREHTPADAVVVTDWDAGYDVQAAAGRATVTDGLLENGENRRRIVALDRALLARTPDSLVHLCDAWGARWMLVPPVGALYSMAAVANDPLAQRIAAGIPYAPGPETDRIAVHLMLRDAPVPGFRPVFESGGYQVFERDTTAAAR